MSLGELSLAVSLIFPSLDCAAAEMECPEVFVTACLVQYRKQISISDGNMTACDTVKASDPETSEV